MVDIEETDLDFYEQFKKYPDSWFEDFMDFYDYMQENKEFMQHPQHALPDEGYRTIAWNTAWVHADLSRKK